MRPLPVPAALVLFAATSSAQSLNVDLGLVSSYSPAPPSSYGGATGQFGVWNSPQAPSGNPTALPPQALVDLAGAPTSAVVSSSAFGAQSQSDFGYAGGFGDVLEDWFETQSAFTLRVDGLAPGAYEVTTYATVLDCTSARTRVAVAGSVEGERIATGGAGLDHVEGATFVRHRVVLSGGPLEIAIAALDGFCFVNVGACNGFQVTRLDGASSVICAGDGTGAACPCGNSGGAGRGCASASAPQGALLAASGVASVSADTLVLTATEIPDASVVFLLGSHALGGGAGAAFGDGLRSAGGAVAFLARKRGANHAARYPDSGDAPVSIQGFVAPAGGTHVAQAWYRSAASYCTSATFNLTNGVRTVWTP